MTSTATWGTPLLEAQQATPEVTHNESLLLLQMLALAGVQGVSNAPPAGSPAPIDGDIWIVGTVPTGAFAGHANALAMKFGTGWVFLPGYDEDTGLPVAMGAAQSGLSAWRHDLNAPWIWDGAAWVTAASITKATAVNVTFTPAGNIAATNVQAAIEELDSEKIAKAGDTFTGDLTGSGASLRLYTPSMAALAWATVIDSTGVVSQNFLRTGGLNQIFSVPGTSLTAPTATPVNTSVLRLRNQGWGADISTGTYGDSGELRYTITDPAFSNLNRLGLWNLTTGNTGSSGATERQGWNEVGWRIGAGNYVMRISRHMIPRLYANTALPAQQSGDVIGSSDINGARLISDGTDWLGDGVRRVRTVTANTTFSVPAGWAIEQVFYFNTTANAVTGGVKFGTTSGAADVIAAQAVGANAIGHVVGTNILLRVFSTTAAQTIFVQAVTAWNSASVEFAIVMKKVF